MGTAAAMDQYRLRQGQVLSAQDAWQKKIMDGKATFRDLINNHKMLGTVLRDQIALQRSMGVSWTQSSKTGKFSVDALIPQNLPRDLKTLRAELGLFSNVMTVASDNMVKWGKNTQWAGRQLMVGFTVPMGIAAAATGKMAYDLDKSLTQVVKVYGDATQEIQQAADSVRSTAMATAEAAARIYGQSADTTLKIMADLAASGKSGNELQQATMQTTRAAILGELDWQSAVKATISMQEVYQAGQKEIGENWNYINAMENQTVLSAQDFVTAIPKVAGVMNELGADLKQTGSLLTAFKAAGIDAAEGANALKSINFRLVATYGKGLETFKQKTGQDLRAIIDETNGETIPSLQKFAAALEDLSAPDKVAVTRDVFGIYQGSKGLMLLEQMIQKTDQWQQALDVANNTALENAAIAQQELDRQNDQPFKKLDKAVESLKLNLAQLGQVFLEPAAMLLGVVGKLVDGFNNMNPAVKTVLAIGAGLVALAGPMVMLAGLGANLAGNVMKGVFSLIQMRTGFKMMTVEERMQQIVSSKMTNAWDTQTVAAAALTTQVQHLTTALNASVMAQGGAAAAAMKNASRPQLPNGVKYDTAGRTRWESGNEYNRPGGQFASAAQVEAARRLQDMQERAQAAEAKMQKLAGTMTMVATTAGVLGSAFGMNSGLTGRLVELMNVVGIFGIMFPSAMTKVVTKVSGVMAALGTRMLSTFGVGQAGAGRLMGALTKAGPIIAGVAIAGFAVWSHFNDQIEESVKKVERFNDYAKSMADILGYSYTPSAKMGDKGPQNGMEATLVLVEKLKKENNEAFQQFASMDKEGVKVGEKWALAISAGLRAKMHGADPASVENTVRVAMSAMGEQFNDADWKLNFDLEANFDDATAMLKLKAKEWKQIIDDALRDNGANWMEAAFNDGDLSAGSAKKVAQAGQDFWDMYLTADPMKRKQLLMDVAQENDKFINDAYKKMTSNASDAEVLRSRGINNAHDLSRAIGEGRLSSSDLSTYGAESFQDLQKRNDFLNNFAQQAARAGGVAEENIPKIATFFDLFQQGKFIDLFGDAPKKTENFTDGLAGLYDGMSGVGKSTSKVYGAMDYFRQAAGGAAVDSEVFTQKLQDLGYQAGITYDEVANSFKGIMTATQSAMFETSGRLFSEFQQSQMDGYQKWAQDQLDALDKKSEANDAKFERRQRAQEARQEKEKRAFDKRWDDRKKREEDAYDARISKIDEAIKAEQKAEDIRQKIFEAEQTRIQRLSQMFSQNIDINAAINSGQLDEAAKLQAAGAAQELQWNLDDSAANAGSASAQRVDDLNKQKDSIEKQKTARMDMLDQIKEREKQDMDDRQKREDQALKDEEARSKKRIENQKKEQAASNKAYIDRKQREQEADRREAETKLAILRAYLPKNAAEAEKQRAAIEAIYKKYGLKLTAYGKEWSGIVGSSLTTAVQTEGNRLKSVVNWASVGSDIANAMIKGAFNMTPQEFAKFINGGTAPDNSLFGSNPQSGLAKTPPRKKTSTYGGRLNDPNDRAYHIGGVVSHGNSPGRVGRSGGRTAGEVDTRLLVGEGVVNREAMRMIGKAGLDNINNKKFGKGGSLGMGSLPAVMGVAAAKPLIQGTLRAAYNARTGAANKFGKNVGVAPDIASIASNAFSAGVSVAYKSGKVVYLGHGGYPGGGNFSGNVKPINGPVTSGFGPRNFLGMSFHNGIDLGAASGTPIRASQGGRVIYTGWDNTGYGNYTEIQSSDGSMYGYGHQSSIGVRAGMKVATGQMIGRVGSTGKSSGPHLHFQIGRNGQWFNPKTVMPQLKTGGFTMNEGLANLHPNETVLTAPLTEQFKQGVQNFAESGNSHYTVTIDMTGAQINSDIDWETGVENALRKIDRRRGVNRKVGG